MRGRLTFGLFIIAIGGLILLRNMNVLDFSLGALIAKLWPLLLIIWGLGHLFERTGPGGRLYGIIIALIGFIFLGRNLDWFGFDISLFWKLLWPVFLILTGVTVLVKSFSGGKSHFALMSGIQEKDAWKLERGIYWALMGSIELDLRKAEIPEGKTTIQTVTVMGGIDIIVPPGLAVICEGTSILGGVEFFNKESGGILANLQAEQGDVKNSPKIVRINCLAIMGGTEVKSIGN